MKSSLKFIAYLFTGFVITATASPIEFYASNNQGQINQQTAYERMIGHEQKELKDDIIDIMQANHMEQGRCDDLLGSYQMAGDQTVTADNTKVYEMSPYQKFKKPQAFKIAKQLADRLHQESVAVFVPENRMDVGKIAVKFTGSKPTLNELNTLLNEKLPADYKQAYSVVLDNEYADFNVLKVAEIHFLGNKKNVQTVQTAFQTEEVKLYKGSAYLVYQDGHVDGI